MRGTFLIILVTLISYTCGNKTIDEAAINDELTKTSGNQLNGLVKPGNVNEGTIKDISTEFGERIIIRLTPFIPDYAGFSNTEKNMISSRLNAAVAEICYGGEGGNPRFIIAPSINILSSELTSSAPTLHSLTYEVNFLVADMIDKTVFASYTTQFKGVGQSSVKAFINGFRDVNLKTADFYNFLKNAESKIEDYYTQYCDKFLQQAKAESDERNFEMAYIILKNIPLECVDCFEKAQSQRKIVFNELLKEKCNELVMQMKGELGKMNDESASGYNEEAMVLFALIDPASSCYSEAQKIYEKYIGGLKPEQKRNWDKKKMEYEMLQKQTDQAAAYKRDSIEQAFAFKSKEMELENSIEAISNKILLEKYKKEHYYSRQPWLRKIFHLGDLDPFDGYSEESI